MSQTKLIIGILVGTVVVLVGVGLLMTRLGGNDKRVVDAVGEARLATGSAQAKVTIVEFSDFQCPACRQAQPAIKQILEEFPGQVRLVYRHFPLTQIHKQAMAAAELAEAAYAQGKFWETHDVLFERQEEWSVDKDKLTAYAQELGIEAEGKYQDKIEADVRDGQRLGINATPTFFVNGRKTSVVNLKTTVEAELKK